MNNFYHLTVLDLYYNPMNLSCECCSNMRKLRYPHLISNSDTLLTVKFGCALRLTGFSRSSLEDKEKTCKNTSRQTTKKLKDKNNWKNYNNCWFVEDDRKDGVLVRFSVYERTNYDPGTYGWSVKYFFPKSSNDTFFSPYKSTLVYKTRDDAINDVIEIFK